MALTAAEKQHKRRERLKARGLVHVQGWVTPEQAGAIRAIMQGLPTVFHPETPPERPAGQGDHIPAQQAEPPQRASVTGKTTVPESPAPKLKKGEGPGQWRVLIDGEEIGTVTREHHAAFAGTPAHDRWKPHRKGSMLDALSERTYKNREQAVKALVSSVTR